MTADGMKEFNQSLKAMTDQQVLNVYRKERDANREDYAELAYLELCNRGIA